MMNKITVSVEVDSALAQLIIAVCSVFLNDESTLGHDMAADLLPRALGYIASLLSEAKRNGFDNLDWSDEERVFIDEIVKLSGYRDANHGR